MIVGEPHRSESFATTISAFGPDSTPMRFHSSNEPITRLHTQCLALPLSEAREFDESLAPKGYLRSVLRDMKDEPGEALRIALPEGAGCEQVIAYGVGDTCILKDLRKIGSAIGAAIVTHEVTQAAISIRGIQAQGASERQAIRALFAGVANEIYRFRKHKAEVRETPQVESLTLCGAHEQSRTLELVEALNRGHTLARDLGNLPGNECTPDYLLQASEDLSTSLGLKCTSLGERDMEERGMGAFLSVSRGSAREGRLIRLDYTGGADAKAPPIVLVGKGITFDTGGISLKKPEAMDEMKFDMCGAAAVLGAMCAAATAKLPLNITSIVAAAENMPSGTASRPGDVVTTMSGTTVEILNTDAEGRLVLCDALSYARELKPRSVIDLATLTGACIVALGDKTSGLFTPDDQLAEHLIHAGELSGDRVWRMPVWEDYREQLKTPLADLANIGGSKAGAITAAAFLSTFTEDLSWAHIDIAGTAWKSGADKGATGAGVPVLFEYLLAQSEEH